MSTAEALRCPYCLADLDAAVERVVRCAKCQTPHHGACFAEHGRCTLLGCGETETESGEGAPALSLASLHPFLPMMEGLLQRTASFLSVRQGERDRRKVRGRGRGMTLVAPEAAVLGQPLELTLDAFTPIKLGGEGIRLDVRSFLGAGSGKVLDLSHQEAVLLGRANRSWRSKLKLWGREKPMGLLLPGRTPFELSFDPTPLAWRGPLAHGTGGGGPRQWVEVQAYLDGSRGMSSDVHRVVLLDDRAPPKGLELELVLGTRIDVPPLGTLDGPPAWIPHPVTTWKRTDERILATAQIALRHDEHDPHDLPTADALDLEVQALARGAKVIQGEVALLLHRPQLRGRLVLQFVVERLTYRRGQREWRAYARETAVLYDGSREDVDVSGRHAFAFRHVVPPCFFWGKPSEPRRVLVRALLLGEGVPLRSEERELVVKGLRRRGRG